MIQPLSEPSRIIIATTRSIMLKRPLCRRLQLHRATDIETLRNLGTEQSARLNVRVLKDMALRNQSVVMVTRSMKVKAEITKSAGIVTKMVIVHTIGMAVTTDEPKILLTVLQRRKSILFWTCCSSLSEKV